MIHRLLLIVCVILVPVDAFAYIDPGAGSMAYQALIAVALGAGVLVRGVRAKLRDAWRVVSARLGRNSV